MTSVIDVAGLGRRFGTVSALDEVSFRIEEGTICGLLGRNGAGKTTLMQLLTGQDFATTGSVSVFGESPVENAGVLSRICFIKESQRYPDDFTVAHVLKSAPWFFPHWDEAFAASLATEFRLPVARRIKKLSRGQVSAVGVVVGLASRAPITFFDEPYLGLDAVARHLFYDRLLEDYAAHPRTVILSTHLIDEVGDLLEHVLVIDEGRVIMDLPAEQARASAVTVSGTATAVDAFIADRAVLHRAALGGLATAVVAGVSAADRAAARDLRLEVSPVSLQQLIVTSTGTAGERAEHTA